MVSKIQKAKESVQSRIWKSTVVWHFYYLLPLSNLFHCLCHVSPSILKTPQTSLFLTQYKYIWTSFYHTLLYWFCNSTFLRLTFKIYIFYRWRSRSLDVSFLLGIHFCQSLARRSAPHRACFQCKKKTHSSAIQRVPSWQLECHDQNGNGSRSSWQWKKKKKIFGLKQR